MADGWIPVATIEASDGHLGAILLEYKVEFTPYAMHAIDIGRMN